VAGAAVATVGATAAPAQQVGSVVRRLASGTGTFATERPSLYFL
jgi:hypothetical protein